MKPPFLKLPAVLPIFRGILGSAMLFAAVSVWAQPVTISRDSPLYAEARAGSSVVAQLKQGAPGEVVGKQGAWLNVKSASGTGWLLSTNVRYGEAATSSAPAKSGSGGWNPFARSPSTQATATIGIRGFDEATIGSAMGDGAPVSAAQLAQLDGFKVEKPGGVAHASSKGLQAAKVDY